MTPLRIGLAALLGVTLAAALAALIVATRTPQRVPAVAASRPDPSVIAHGSYLARAGDCVSCHTAPGGVPYAGGYTLKTPFGAFYPPNLTSDNETGLGRWTSDDFWRALHEGKGRDGLLLYPAFPYDSYTRITRADADALFAFLKAAPAVHAARPAPALDFPYNQRELLVGWRALYFKPGVFEPDVAHDAAWNRGAYLVDGLGHCSACHSQRNALGASDAENPLSGGVIPTSNWYAPPLTSNPETGLGTWSVEDIEALLKSGVSARASVYGPMAEVVRNSLQFLNDADIRAIAVYLKSEAGQGAVPKSDGPPGNELAAMMDRGAKIYDLRCKGCHLSSGAGQPPAYPPLAGNGSVTTRTAINPIRLVLHGGFAPSTRDNPRPYGMPPFGYVLNERDVAAVVTYIRRSWGNEASAVAPGEVEKARSIDQ